MADQKTIRNRIELPDNYGHQYQAEAVLGGIYIAAAHVVPTYMVEQLKHPENIEAATWAELDKIIAGAEKEGRGTPAIDVIVDQRLQMQRISQTAQALQQKVAELSNALEAAHIATHRANEKAVELLGQRDQLEAAISVLEHSGVANGRLPGRDLATFENAVAVARRIRIARAEAQAGVDDVVDAEFGDEPGALL